MSKSTARKFHLSAALLFFAATWMTTASQDIFAQAATTPTVKATIKTPVFDVVSIRPNNSGSGGMSWDTHNDSFSATNASPMLLLSIAYGLRQDQISGAPNWTRTTRFDIKAKVVDPDIEALKKLTDEQQEEMLQAVLAARFQLKAHKETRIAPTYDLVVAKSGPKLKEAAPPNAAGEANDPRRGSWSSGNGKFTGTAIPVESLADHLSQKLEHTVLDKTGLAGSYNIELQWTQDDTQEASAESSGPSIFTALQEQLGLKLQPSKGPVETLVIDHIEMPSNNEN